MLFKENTSYEVLCKVERKGKPFEIAANSYMLVDSPHEEALLKLPKVPSVRREVRGVLQK